MRKAHFAGVRCLAAMMRSPSFSRDGESSTMRNFPAARRRHEGLAGSKSEEKNHLRALDERKCTEVFYARGNV